MRIREGHIVCKTLGGQLTLELLSGLWAVVLYFLSDLYFAVVPWFFAIVKGIMLFLAGYYFVYSYLLTKKIVEKYFK